MKQLLLFLTLLSPFLTPGQETINGSDIIKDIDLGKNIFYKNITIEGDLDFTTLNTNVDKNGGEFFNIDDEKITITIEKDIRFENCKFNGEVIGYVNNDKEDILYSTRFRGKFSLKNCTFNKSITFKYSSFYNVVTITNSNFEADVEFKYTNFESNVDFTGSEFNQGNNFKYTNFK